MGSSQYWPIQLDIPGCRVVELACGGWSFSALDSDGQIHVWGQLESGYGLTRDGFSHNTKQASRPLRLGLPTRIKAISCGRNFTTALDHQGKIWCFNSWGRPFVFHANAFDQSNPDNAIIQVECGWTFSAVLNASGNVFVWNPLEGPVGTAVTEREAAFDNLQEDDANDVNGNEIDGIIQCHSWELQGVEPLKLPELPRLPNLTDGEVTQPRLVKVAAGDQFIIGLTDAGHVVKLDLTDINTPDATTSLGLLFQRRARGWEYLPLFSETNEVRELEEFKTPQGPAPPSQLKISHVSAHFLTFAAYSTGENSIVLMGQNDVSAESKPTIIPALQNRGVISIVLGDYQFGALLENGALLTWGQAASTGLGDPYAISPGQPGGFRTEEEKRRSLTLFQSIPDIPNPTEVRFDHELARPRKRFVFSAAAAGWHMGALVVDLEEGEPEPKAKEVPKSDNDEPDTAAPIHRTGPPGMFPPFLFRGAPMLFQGPNPMQGIQPPRSQSADE